jgi:UDP-N-acetylglucosamine 1-carboxyvinyltransferase
VNAEMIPDRIETGTHICAIGMTGGNVTIAGADVNNIESPVACARQMGVQVKVSEGGLTVTRGREALKPIDVCTEPYPGFPTDLQAPFMAMACLAEGKSRITDTIYKDRFTHVAELYRLGADIQMHDNTAVINGIGEFKGAPVMSTDLRASVCLVLAGLAAKGITHVKRIYHLDRGYEKIEEKYSRVGAEIHREEGEP